jgi:hypothetical protein
MRDGIEGRFDVRVQYPAVAVGAELVDLRDCVVCPPFGPKPVVVLR